MNRQEFLISSPIGSFGFPDTIKVQHSGFDVNAYHQSLFRHYQVDFPFNLGKAVDKRCAEYLAGRIVAKQAIGLMNGTKPQIGSNKDRSPIWPKGLIGSITHSDGVVVAAVAEQKHHRLLGIDFEYWMSAHLADELCDPLLDQSEKQLLLQTDLAFEHGVTLIFSVKESFYKALYPHVNTFFGFDEARVRSIDITSGAFTIELLTSFGKGYQQGWSIKGYFKVLSDGLLTYIYG